MNLNITNSQTIDFDENIITQLKELIDNGLNKLRSFVKSRTKPNLDFYNELDCEFDEISSKLEYLELWQEHRYFLSIKRMILYIIRENSYDPHFGHCNFALELLKFFIEMFKTNIEFYKDDEIINTPYFNDYQEAYKKKYYDYRRIYYQNIYKSSEGYSENYAYEFLKSLKE